ncbi:MAG: prepilin-type N-terminal cleavage/methylation domain-containing protein [Planctomycetes bacterium]|nr:prepilin-type N-terminal cleavage/methylation domain-containing protein [Planctomycetota bacterium]
MRRSARARRRSTARRSLARAGFTLVELLLVIGILALVFGLGFGAILRLDFGEQVALAEVQTTLRSARNFAVAQRSPARATFDRATGTMRASGLATIGTWRFESDALDGAFGIAGVHTGGKLVDGGFRGKGLSFAGEPPRSRVELPLQQDPACVLRDGFRITLAIRPADGEQEGGGTLLAFGESIGVETSSDGSIQAWFAPEIVEDKGGTMRGGKITLKTDANVLRAGRWSELAIAYDRATFVVEVDRVACAARREDAPVWKAEGALALSPANEPWPGTLDDLVVACVHAGDELRLPSKVSFAASTPAEVRFAAGGGLDRDAHEGPVAIALEYEDGRTQTAQVSLFGMVE